MGLSPVRGVKRTLQCPLAGELEDHNLTYSYSSSEEEEDVSPPVRMSPRSPRSAQSSLRRLALTRGMEAKQMEAREMETKEIDAGEKGGKYEDLMRIVENVRTESASVSNVLRKLDVESEGKETSLENSITVLNSVIDKLQLEAGNIIKEIQSTHCRVVKELAEAEKVKSDYLDIRQKTEALLVLLRLEEKRTKLNL